MHDGRGLEGNYLSRIGTIVRDRINLVYTDTPFASPEHFSLIEVYADELQDAGLKALEEEAILVTVSRVWHAGDR